VNLPTNSVTATPQYVAVGTKTAKRGCSNGVPWRLGMLFVWMYVKGDGENCYADPKAQVLKQRRISKLEDIGEPQFEEV
jgi:hypothetical protein